MFAHNPFRIRDYKNFDKPEGQDQSFESAKKWFDERTHESMTRRPLEDKEFKKVLPMKNVIMGLMFLFGTNKAVCRVIS